MVQMAAAIQMDHSQIHALSLSPPMLKQSHFLRRLYPFRSNIRGLRGAVANSARRPLSGIAQRKPRAESADMAPQKPQPGGFNTAMAREGSAEGSQFRVGDRFRVPGLVLTNIHFRSPLDHSKPDGEQIDIFARVASHPNHGPEAKVPFLLYLQGMKHGHDPPPSPCILFSCTHVCDSVPLCLPTALKPTYGPRRPWIRSPAAHGGVVLDQACSGRVQVRSHSRAHMTRAQVAPCGWSAVLRRLLCGPTP